MVGYPGCIQINWNLSRKERKYRDSKKVQVGANICVFTSRIRKCSVTVITFIEKFVEKVHLLSRGMREDSDINGGD